MDGGPLAITHHLDHNSQLLSEPSLEHDLNPTIYLRKIRYLVPVIDLTHDQTPS
jgi:hypothetical protein